MNEEEKKDAINKEEKEDNVTREINLDDLYDGAVNNTVVIDPVTNSEVLIANKKKNYTFLGIILAILAILVLYYVNNKTEFGNTTKKVESKTTTKQVTTKSDSNGVLTCIYSSKSDAENQDVTYTLKYEAGKLTNSTFNYVVVSNTDSSSAVIDDLKTQYESFFVNNASVKGNTVTYEKNGLGFTFNVDTNYKIDGFDNLSISEGQTILFVKPTKEDTIDLLKESYTNKGFTCQISSENTDE